METEVIKSFLVGLGFGVNDSDLAKFNKAIVSASLKVTALYTSIQVAAAGIFKGISGISQGFEDMGYQLRLVAPAINKMLILRQAMLAAYGAAGINLVKAVRQSILFNYSLAKTKFALEAVYKSVGIKFLPLLTKQMDIFRAKIFANMPKIQAILTNFVNIVFKAFAVTVQLGTTLWSILGRVWDFLKELDTATDGWSTKILAVVTAWKLFNLAFLATPLGLVLAGLVAILALYDDFKVWQEGGESFFNWSKFVPIIHAFGEALSALVIIWKANIQFVSDFVYTLYKLLTFDFNGFKVGWVSMARDIQNAIGGMISYLKAFWDYGKAIVGWIPTVAGTIGGIFGNGAPPISGITQPQPLLPQGAGSNQKVSQETNIVVQGSADANSVGRAVASQQDKVNFDMVRNMRGAMR